METVDLNSWAEFRGTIEDIRQRFGRLQLTDSVSKKNVILFRGHGDAAWCLQTTLERWTDQRLSVHDYMIYADRCSNELESLTGRRWDISSISNLEEKIRANQDSFRVYLPCYEYLVYLRHHGFPSPLLDWTASPYIAAYFAYCDRPPTDRVRVAVYAYIERPHGSKGGVGGHPMISVQGPFVSAHSRHFAQKAWYTTATKYEYEKEKHFFCNHSAVFTMADTNPSLPKNHQDVLFKVTIPASDRLSALQELNDYNINHFTLFQTEDALVKALAIREFDLDDT